MNSTSIRPIIAFCLLYVATITLVAVSDFKIVALALPLIWLSVTDFVDRIIPDLAVLAIVLWGVAVREPLVSNDLLVDVLAASVILVVLWGIGEFYWRKNVQEALGFGDAKLLAAVVLCVGWERAMWVIVIAAVGGIALVLSGRLLGNRNQDGIPFGPFIGYALFMAVNRVGGL